MAALYNLGVLGLWVSSGCFGLFSLSAIQTRWGAGVSMKDRG
jgi:hypothetical protein